ncbi:MAG: hypothetical protein K0U29_07620 [Gammaproteobacteria bacterium]|nr:hypothetical protein [Gammaproteobacteria bacterium]MCH9744781.1 hypothetical protein [Gammaproteobacteria bacterium]
MWRFFDCCFGQRENSQFKRREIDIETRRNAVADAAPLIIAQRTPPVKFFIAKLNGIKDLELLRYEAKQYSQKNPDDISPANEYFKMMLQLEENRHRGMGLIGGDSLLIFREPDAVEYVQRHFSSYLSQAACLVDPFIYSRIKLGSV